MHSEMWWPRLLAQHGEIAWDDYEKDYSDLPETVMQRHRQADQEGRVGTAAGRGQGQGPTAAVGAGTCCCCWGCWLCVI